MRPLRSILLSTLISIGMAVCAASAHAQFVRAGDGPKVIERVYIRRSSPHDPGALIAILRNTTDAPVEVGRIEVNGHPLEQWPEPVNPVAWGRLTHDRLAPGQTALLIAKFVRPLNGMIRLSIILNNEAEQVLLSGESIEPVRVTAVRYGLDGERINVFVKNAGDNPQRLQSIKINDRSVWQSTGEDQPLPPGTLTPFQVKLDQPLEAGRRLLLTLRLADRRIAVVDRAIPGFRLSIESGHKEMAKRIGADPLVLETFQFKKESARPASQRQAAESLIERQGEYWSVVRVSHGRFVSKQESDLACVFACPTHATDSYQTAAYLAARAQRQIEGASRSGGAYPSFIHACRTQPLEGIAVFGSIADAIRFNAQLATSVTHKTAHRDKVPWTVYTLTRYAAQAAAPSSALPMIPLERDRSLFGGRAPLATEARQMIYAALAAGAGGVAYRVMPQDWRDENRDRMLDEVKTVNQEIRQVRDLLAMGFPRNLASVDDPLIQVACIDARPLGLVVLMINHDLRRSPPAMPPSVTARPHEQVTLKLDLPDGFEPGRVQSIDGSEVRAVEGLAVSRQQATLTLDVPGATGMLVIRPK